MIDVFLEIFYATCENLIPLIIPVFCVYLIVKITSDLLFK